MSMELNVTRFITENQDNMMDFSASVMERGQCAGQITWQASLDSVDEYAFLDTEEKLQEARDHFSEYGAWTKEEINAWTDTELNALVNQEIAASYREMEGLDDIQEAMEQGQLFSRLFLSDNEWFFYLGM